MHSPSNLDSNDTVVLCHIKCYNQCQITRLEPGWMDWNVGLVGHTDSEKYLTLNHLQHFRRRCSPHLFNSGWCVAELNGVCKPRLFMKHLFHIKVEVDTFRMWTDSSEWIIFAAGCTLQRLTFFRIPSLGHRTQLWACFWKIRHWYTRRVCLTCSCVRQFSPQNICMNYTWLTGSSPMTTSSVTVFQQVLTWRESPPLHSRRLSVFLPLKDGEVSAGLTWQTREESKWRMLDPTVQSFTHLT